MFASKKLSKIIMSAVCFCDFLFFSIFLSSYPDWDFSTSIMSKLNDINNDILGGMSLLQHFKLGFQIVLNIVIGASKLSYLSKNSSTPIPSIKDDSSLTVEFFKLPSLLE